MKRFLKYDTEDAKNGVGPVDKNGVIKKDISGGGMQPDWNQIEESEPDFIKNKPFGKVKGKKVIDETYLQASLVDGKYTHTFSESMPWNSEKEPKSVRVIIKIVSGYQTGTKIYDNVPVIEFMWVQQIGGYAFTVGGEGYPFTISSSGITIESDTAIDIFNIEVWDMNDVSNVTIPSNYLPKEDLANVMDDYFPRLKSTPEMSNNGDMLFYDHGSYKFGLRSYLIIKSSSGKKFKLIVDDSGTLSTEEITS